MSKSKNVILWILSFVLMLGIAVYQRMTGPTHPKRVNIEINGQEVSDKLLRSSDDAEGALIEFEVAPEFTAEIYFKRFKSHDKWTIKEMTRDGENLTFRLPRLANAGKFEYNIHIIEQNGTKHQLTEDNVILRYKGAVPAYILIPHIIFMFTAMWVSIRVLFEFFVKGDRLYRYTVYTTLAMLIGGLILGPIVQKFAFGAYWTGWPFGHDLTDNKTIVAFIFWLIALWQLKKNQAKRFWALIAVFVIFAVYLIPHSVLGSEIDYRKTDETEQAD